MPTLQIQQVPRALMSPRATFTTLTLDGRLRGCIGARVATKPLVRDVAESAFKAAFGDPRFPPLRAEELPRLAVEVAILGPMRPWAVADRAALVDGLVPGVDGLVLQDGLRAGLFLPKVWDSLPTAEAFVGQLLRKAGLAPDHWSDTLRVWRFSAETVAAEPA